ncbi:hypothetical protein O0L34_g10868 [Tuta absoluta]|nr:hypothetical protein O0L34_g10868 [Tuta absoluta]
MATKSYSKHKEFKEYSSSGSATVPYTDEQFDMLKSELIPRGSKLEDVARTGAGAREYHYEYKEEKHPSGKYDRKDLHTVEEYTIPPKTKPKSSESSSYYYEREERELPTFGTGSRTYNYETVTSGTPGYSKIKSSKATKELSHNVEELDSLLDDLQKDQDRQLYKSGYTSDTAESTSFDYKRGTPVKAPSSGYSTLKREERLESSSWGSSPPPPVISKAAEIRQELYKEERTESRVVPAAISPAVPLAVSQTVCHNCHSSTGTLSRSSTPMNKVTTTVKTYTYEVPAGQDPTSVPLPPVADHTHTYLSTNNNYTSTNTTSKVPPSPSLGGCQYCSHCNTRVREFKTVTTSDVTDHSTIGHTNERIVYPTPANKVELLPVNHAPDHNGHGPYGPTSYKYSETTYSSQNTTERYPPAGTPAPFPRPSTPNPGTQQPPKRLDDLMADLTDSPFPVSPSDGVVQRKVTVSHERSTADTSAKPAPAVGTRNVAGPPVYYPPGHVPFEKKSEGYQAAAMQGGGAHASGRGMYEYESGSRSKEKHTEKKTAVPVCLPLCCAMPCVIM